MADQDPINPNNGSGPQGEPGRRAADRRTIAQYIKDLSVESPNAPAVFQWQVQPQLDVQFSINGNKVADDVHEVVLKIERQRQVGQRHPFHHRPQLRRPVRLPQHPRGCARRRSCWSRRRACCSRSPARSSPKRSRTSASRRSCSTRSISPRPMSQQLEATQQASRVRRSGDGEPPVGHADENQG